uniref:Roundabout 2 n=1 Tax=Rhabditophanes sp. KR3021 TaxID=114890 RepID=A0AC35U446_9BILA
MNIFLDRTPGPPIIIEHPLDTLVVNNDPVTLPCRVQDDIANITWYKNDEPIKIGANVHRILLNSGSLFLLQVKTYGKDADTGTYYCIAKNIHGEARSQDATVRVATLKEDFKTRPRNVNVVIGSRAIIECAGPKGFPEPEIYWKKESKEIRSQEDTRITIHPHGNLIIENVQKSDAGNYQCIAMNAVGTRESNTAKLSVHAKPVFIVPPRDRTAEIGSSVFFDCQASGDPMPSITFKKNGEPMPVGRAYIHPNNKGLTIQDVQVADAGEYICIAENSAGRIETSGKLKVHSQPKFVKKPIDVNIKAGETAYFECKTSGIPQPDVFWSKESQQDVTIFQGKSSNDGRMKVTNDGNLLVTDVRLDDEGIYICAAVNSAGSSTAETSLKVISKALSASPPPLIQYGHMNQTLLVAGNAILPCVASGIAPLTISWLKNEKEIELTNPKSSQFDERFRQLATGSLQIFNLLKNDSGIYTCNVKNSNGQTTWTASLVVEEHSNRDVHFQRMSDASTLPSTPGKPIPSNITENSVQLDWTVPDKSGASMISGYILAYYSPEIGETWFNIPDYVPTNSFTVKNLKSNCTYVFVVRSENTNGIGPPSEISHVIYTKTNKNIAAQLSTAQLSLELAKQRLGSEQLIKLEEVKVLNSSAIQLSWKRRKEEPLIQGYYIKWRGPPLTLEQTFINVTSSLVESYIVNGLKPFTTYEFFMIPYHRTIQGMPSNSMDATTKESVPTSAPTDVRVRMHNITTLKISWRPPATDGMNGVLKGFYILITGEDYTRNITTNERAGSVTLYYLSPKKEYKIRVAARTDEGIGIFHGIERVTMDEETLKLHLEMANANKTGGIGGYITNTWAIVGLGSTVWLLLTTFLICVWYRWKKNKNGKANVRLGMPFIKINDGSVHFSGHDGLWMDHGNYGGQFPQQQGQPMECSGHHDQQQQYHDPYINTLQRCMANGNFPSEGFNDMNGVSSIARTSSPHQYSYAAFPGNVNTFNRRQYGDDPSPYATTTLIMNGHDESPQVPTAPVPQEPPLSFCMHDLNKQHAIRTNRSLGSVNSINRFKPHQGNFAPTRNYTTPAEDNGDTGNYVQVARDYDPPYPRSNPHHPCYKPGSANNINAVKNQISKSSSRTINPNSLNSNRTRPGGFMNNSQDVLNNTQHQSQVDIVERSHTLRNDERLYNGKPHVKKRTTVPSRKHILQENNSSDDEQSAHSSLINHQDKSFGSDEDYHSGSISSANKPQYIHAHESNGVVVVNNKRPQPCMGISASSLHQQMSVGESAKNRFGRPYISGRPLLNCDRKKIIELFGNGYKKIAIAREIGVTHSCVSKVIKKYAETGIYEGKETRTASCACPGGSSNHDSRICRNTKFIKTENSLTTISLANKYKSSHLVSNFKRPNKSKKAVGFSVDFILSDKCGQR